MINLESCNVSFTESMFSIGKKENDPIMKKIIHDKPYLKRKTPYLQNYHQLVQIMLRKKQRLKTTQQFNTGGNLISAQLFASTSQKKSKSSEKRDLDDQMTSTKLLKQSQNIKKISLNTKNERSKSRHKWKQHILRRKNNGSQGKIITGLTSNRHILGCHKVKDIKNEDIQIKDIQFEDILFQSKNDFQPIGIANTTNRTKNLQKTGESSGFNSFKLKIRKKSQFQHNNKEKDINYRSIQTEHSELNRKRLLTKSTNAKYSPSKEKQIFYQTQRSCKPLSPWHQPS